MLTTLQYFYNQISQHIDKLVYYRYFDFSKAFNYVQHTLLKQKLHPHNSKP